MSAFCREHGLCEQTFYFWRKRVRPDAILPAVKAGFAEVAMEAAGVREKRHTKLTDTSNSGGRV